MPGDLVLKRIILLAGAAGLLSTAAIAQPELRASTPPEPSSATAPSTSTDAKAEVDDPDKLICKTVKPVTGTRVSSARTRTKMCMTKREWDEQAEEAKQALRTGTDGQFSRPNGTGR